jgi:hypothetical protein
MGLNVIALGLFAANLGIHVGRWGAAIPGGSTSGIILSAIGILATLGAGFLGWSMVQDHGVGVASDAVRELQGQPASRERVPALR